MHLPTLAALSTSQPVSFFSFFPQLLFWLMLAGIAGFFYGFRLLRFKRLIQNTPFSKMGSAAIGLVEVSGRASGPRTIPAGLTNTPCFYYKATLWQRKTSSHNSDWRQVVEERMCVPFYVEDSAGKLLVRPQEAETEGYRTLKEEYGALIYRSREALPKGVRNFIARNGVDDSKDMRVEEHCIRPSELLFVIGTLGETPPSASWGAQPHYGGKSKSLGLVVIRPKVRTPSVSLKITRNAGTKTWTVNSTPGLGASGLEPVVVKQISDGSGQKAIAIVVNNAVLNPRGEAMRAPLQTASQGPIQLPEAALEQISKVTHGAFSKERIGELLRQAAELPSAEVTEPLPKVSIGMAAPSNLFIISYKSQREVVQTMGTGATLRIWGGPMLAILCLYFLLAMLFTPW
jgi:hypothetical protein